MSAAVSMEENHQQKRATKHHWAGSPKRRGVYVQWNFFGTKESGGREESPSHW